MLSRFRSYYVNTKNRKKYRAADIWADDYEEAVDIADTLSVTLNVSLVVTNKVGDAYFPERKTLDIKEVYHSLLMHNIDLKFEGNSEQAFKDGLTLLFSRQNNRLRSALIFALIQDGIPQTKNVASILTKLEEKYIW